MSSNSNTVIHTSGKSTISGSSRFTHTFTQCNNPSNLNTINVTNSKISPYNLIAQNKLKDSLYQAFDEMSQEDCAKILYACLTKMLSDEKREELETLLKMCNNYQTVVKQIIKL